MINIESSDHSPAYFALLAMIEKSWLLMGPTTLKEYLEALEKKGDITTAEHNTLLTLAIRKMKNNHSAT